MKILIADDSKPARMLTSRALKKFRVDMAEAADGEEAYEKMKVEEYDMVLLDNNMPKNTWCRCADETQRRGKISQCDHDFCSNDKATIGTARDNGALDYIIKPYKMDQLVEKINETFSKLGKSTLNA